MRQDLTYPGKIGGLIWNDQKSGANGDIGVWSIDAPDGASDTYGFIAANTFAAVSNYNQPATDPAANVLMLPFPTTSADDPEPPVLTGKAKPDDQTAPVKDHTVLVPFTGITDQQQSLDWQIRNSPFYTVGRYVFYSLVLFNNNQTQEKQRSTQAVTVGVDKTSSNEFSVDTNITVGYEAGVSLGESAKVSASLSVSLGYKQSTSVSVMKSTTVSSELLTPPQHAAALWTASYQLQLVRADGTRVGLPLQFQAASSSFLQSQYPEPETAAELQSTRTFAF